MAKTNLCQEIVLKQIHINIYFFIKMIQNDQLAAGKKIENEIKKWDARF